MDQENLESIETSEPPQQLIPIEELKLIKSSKKKLGIALVGLGKYCTTKLMPAIEVSEHFRIAAIVTGSIDKAEEYGKKYDLSENNIYNYENFDNIKNNREVDIVYIVLPNSMHAEYTIRAAQAGKHVICEKPMAISSKECESMIKACKEAKRMLFIGYRLHYEPFNMEAMRFGQQKLKGEIKKIEADFGISIGENVWRLKKNLAGGGSLFDVGIYTIQGACYVVGKDPIAIRNAFIEKDHSKKFSEVEAVVKWEMEFPDGIIANCQASYVDDMDRLYIEEESGWLELNPAFYYEGLGGKTNDGKINVQNINQQKAQLDGIADTILNGAENQISGLMGLRDLKIIEAIYECARKNERVDLRKVLIVSDKEF